MYFYYFIKNCKNIFFVKNQFCQQSRSVFEFAYKTKKLSNNLELGTMLSNIGFMIINRYLYFCYHFSSNFLLLRWQIKQIHAVFHEKCWKIFPIIFSPYGHNSSQSINLLYIEFRRL